MSRENGLWDDCNILLCQDRAMRAGLLLVPIALGEERWTVGIATKEDPDSIVTQFVPVWEWYMLLDNILDVVEALNEKRKTEQE